MTVKQAIVAMMAALLWALPGLRAQDTEAEELWDYTIPEGTEFKLQLHTTVATKTSKEGDRVLATLLDPVIVEDAEVLPRGLRVDGHVGEVSPARRKGRAGWLTILFDTVELSSGEKVSLIGSLTEVFATEGSRVPDIGLEGDLKGGGTSIWKRMTIFTGAAGGGALVGPRTAIMTGVVGLITAIVLPKGKNVSLQAGSVVGMRLDRDLTVSLTQVPEFE